MGAKREEGDSGLRVNMNWLLKQGDKRSLDGRAVVLDSDWRTKGLCDRLKS